MIVVVVLVALNLPGGSSGGDFEPTPRSQVEGRIEGDPNAPVRIVDLSDFQCPHCKTFAEETHPVLLEEYVETGLVSIEFHHLPVLGEASVRAAEAAECAMDQGRFWDMHDLLFLRQGSGFSMNDLKSYGGELAEHFDDFDTTAYETCLDSGTKRQTVIEMGMAAENSGISSTPSFLVNGTLVAGAQPIEVFRQIIDEELAEEGN